MSTNLHPWRIVVLTCLLIGLLLAPTPLARSLEAPEEPAEPDRLVVRIYYADAAQVRELSQFDLWEHNRQERYLVAAVDRFTLAYLQQLGYRVQVDPALTAQLNTPNRPLPGQTTGIPGYPCYRTVEETYAAAQSIVANHPTLATWTDVGDSWEKATPGGQPGYDLMVLKLTNSAVPGPKPKLFITASIHAREYTPAELTTRFAEYLVNNYDVNPDVTWILDHHEVHLMLHANPDGRKHAEAGKSWRKNTNGNYCGPTSNYRGADLNRNFSFQWGCCGGSSSFQCDQTYRGPSPASEPETQAIQGYMTAIFPDQRAPDLSAPAPANATGLYIDIHSYSQLVLWPWGFTSSPAPNATALVTLGRKFAFFNNYTPQQAIELYVTDGTTDDFVYGELGVAAYTFELGTAFFESCSNFENTIVPANMPALLYAAKVVRTPYLTPAGPDALNVAVSSSTVTAGTPVNLTATINDTRYNNSRGTEPTQPIAAAEYYVDTPPWQGGTPIAMAAADGSFNSTVENVTATVNTTGLTPGRHILFVRGRDSAGNWGAFSAVFLTVQAAPCQAPDAVTNLSISRGSGNDVTLTWSPVATADFYQVWRAWDAPYFAPAANAACTAEAGCQAVTGTSFTDAVLGNPATNATYLVRAARSCGAASANSNRVGEFEFALAPAAP
ncbi:MAG: M14 family metallopeptidase [Anaerolineae bacterium]|nr:M14 family metallopeptidase [Anaerolineae bacterium]